MSLNPVYPTTDIAKNLKNLRSMMPENGRMIQEDGTIINVADSITTNITGNVVQRIKLDSWAPKTENVNLYVATTGSDTTGDGTQTNPWATIQYALNKASGYRTTETIIINIADGTYTELIAVPPVATGVIKLLGNITNKENVILKPSVVFSTLFDATKAPNTIIQIDGMTFEDAYFGVYNSGNKVEIGAVHFKNNTFAILALEDATVKFANTLSGRAILEGDNGFGSGITAFATARIVDQVGIQISKFQTAINITDLSVFSFEFGTANDLEITMKNANSAIGIQASNGSFITLFGTTTIDGQAKRANNACIRINDSVFTTVQGGTYNLRNVDNAIWATGDSSMPVADGNWNFTNNNYNVLIGKSVSASDSFGVNITTKYEDEIEHGLERQIRITNETT